MVNCINSIIEMSLCFILGRENVPSVAEVVNRSLKADCTDFTDVFTHKHIELPASSYICSQAHMYEIKINYIDRQ